MGTGAWAASTGSRSSLQPPLPRPSCTGVHNSKSRELNSYAQDDDDDDAERWKQSDATVIMEEAIDSTRAGSDWVPLSEFHSGPLDSTQSGGGMPLLVPVQSAYEDLHPAALTTTTTTTTSKLAKETRNTSSQQRIRHLHGGGGDLEQARRSSATSDDDGGDRVVVVNAHVGVFNRKHIGMLLSVALASLLGTWLKRGVLPLMQIQLEMEPYQVDSAELLLLLPWSCSFVLGFCSDIFPIFGSHHKAYMILGWVLSAAALFIMSILNQGENYHSKILNNDESIDDEERTAIIGGYVFLLGAACFGGILSIMMAEIYVIALSKRESLERRGHVVGTFLLVQFGFQGIAQVIADTAIFRISATGELDPHFAFQDVILFLVGYSLVPIPIIFWFFDDHLENDSSSADTTTAIDDDGDGEDSDFPTGLKEDSNDCGLLQENEQPSSSLASLWLRTKHHWQLLWRALEEKATWQVVCFLCVLIFFSEFTLRYPFLVLDQWSGVTAKTISTGKIFTELMFFLAVFVWKGRCVNTKWGTFVVLSYLGVYIFPPMVYFLLVTFNRARSLELYMFVSSCQGFIRAMAVVLEVVMMVEIAPKGGEGATLGTVVSIATIMRLVSQTFSNLIGYLFGTQLLLTRKDNVGGATSAEATASTSSDDEPMLVATALLLCYTIRLFALLGVVFLPSQKRGLLRLYAAGGRKRFRAWWTISILGVALLIGTILNTLVITPETTCMHILGGSGCDSSATTTGTSVDT